MTQPSDKAMQVAEGLNSDWGLNLSAMEEKELAIRIDAHTQATIQSLKDENAALKARCDRDDKLHRDIMDFALKSGALDGLQRGKTYDAYRAWEAVKDENARAMAVIEELVGVLEDSEGLLESEFRGVAEHDLTGMELLTRIPKALATAKAFKEKVS